MILNYRHSPRSARKFDSDTGTPKSQKKVRIQDEIEVQETENYIQDLTDDVEAANEENLESEVVEEVVVDKKSPKGILKQSQKLLETIKPNTSKFDSGSLKKKIKNPLQRIKKMADQQFKKVKSNRPFIKKIPIVKGEIVLAEDVKILKLKESPKSHRREIPTFEKQDSDDALEIINLDESPMEGRKRREAEAHLVTPDEIIELPKAGDEADHQTSDEVDRRSEQRESTVESIDMSFSEDSSISKKDDSSPPKKREHVYEDIEDYITQITSDIEHVERVSLQQDAKLHRQEHCDPIFDEFSRELNKNIRRSLSAQDDKIRHELAKKIPRISELEKQLSDEDREEKIAQPVLKQMNLLAPISSIDSTSSDEDRRHLSILAEESETSDSNKKKSFDDSSVDREIESLKDDESDVSMTLIEEDLKGLAVVPEETMIHEPIFEKVVIKARAKASEELNQVDVKSADKNEDSTREVVQESRSDEKKEISNESLKAFDEKPKASDEKSKVSEKTLETPDKNQETLDKEPEAQVRTPEDPKEVELPKPTEAPKAPETCDKSTVEADHAVKEDVLVKCDPEALPIKVNKRWAKMRFVLSVLMSVLFHRLTSSSRVPAFDIL